MPACGIWHLSEDLTYEQDVLLHMQLLMLGGEKWHWEKHIWKLLLDLPKTSDLVYEVCICPLQCWQNASWQKLGRVREQEHAIPPHNTPQPTTPCIFA